MKISSEERQRPSGDQSSRECFVNRMASTDDAADRARHGCRRSPLAALDTGGCALELARAAPANHA
jgi:hypothetical protein